MRLIYHASLLMLISAAGQASPWQCSSTADGLWDCIAPAIPDATAQPATAPRTVIDTPTTTTVEPVSVSPGTLNSEAVTDTQATTTPTTQTPANATPLFPTVIPGSTQTSTPGTTTDTAATVEQATTNTTAPAPETAAPTSDSSANTVLIDNTVKTDPTSSSVETTRAKQPIDTRWALCPPIDYRRVLTPVPVAGAVELQADNARARDNNIFILEGDAVAEMDWQRLEADTLTYDQDAGRIDAAGNLLYTSPELLVDGDRGTLFPDTDTGNIEQAVYALPAQHARGTASSLQLDGRDWQTLRDVSYTTCPEGNTTWEIFADKVDLDQQDGSGTARHAKVEFKGVPVLYTPYLTFPLDDRRKSGFLFPRAGFTDETGFDLSTPYYWNIAPDKDATLVPRFMGDRGVMLGGEFRYLNKTNRGTFTGEYIPSDRQSDENNRYLVGFVHRGQPLPRLETHIRASQVSDDDYFDDFGDTLVQTSQTNLNRVASTAYHGRGWNVGLMVQNYQTIDPTIADTNRPYEQLPRVTFDMAPASRLLGMKFAANVEANNFRHSGNVLVEGSRFDIQPTLSLPVYRPGWYVDPAVSVRYTAYNLDGSTADDHPTRTTPIFSLDTGSIFERSSRWGNTDYVQTLEPRLFYLYVPDKNQDDIPVFDTGEYDFNFWTLFRDNRFSGPDRMGDANQLAVALTSRLLDPASGIEQLSVSVGSLLYFRDREVTLPGEAVATDSTSNIIGELTLGLTQDWRARAETQWNPHASQFDRNSIHLQYRKGTRQLFNIAYRYRRGIQEQTDLSALWPLGNNWHLVGRWYYSLLNSETLEGLAGIGYESCCWSAQLVGRSYIKSRDTRSNAVFFQVELKGLGNLVNTVDKALERGILGYESINDPY